MNKKLISLLFLFFVIVLFVKFKIFFNLEIWLLRIINTVFVNSILDFFMFFITEIGGSIFLIALFFFLFFYKRKIAKKLAISSIILYISIYLTKLLVFRSRPFIDFEWVRNLVIPSTDSFPSRHAAQAFLIAYLINKEFNFNGWKRFIIYFLAILVSYSRIYLGVHYPLDVIGGAIFGILIGLIIIKK